MLRRLLNTTCLASLLLLFVGAPAYCKESAPKDDIPWWKKAVFYEIYLRSFQDTNGDGVGDLKGVIKRIDYLKDLGIDAVYLSSFFPSPNRDWGYDITDFKDVDKAYGTLADFDELVRKLHKSGIKLVIDFVANHTSDQHPWFKESRTSRFSQKNNWYIWHLGKGGGEPPTNWLSRYGGSAWSFDGGREEYYYHSLLPSEPDLNWRHPEVRTAMADVLKYWIKLGVDGFVLSDAAQLTENTQSVDEPKNPYPYFNMPNYEENLHPHTENWVDTHDYVRAIRRIINESCPACVFIVRNNLFPRELPFWYGSKDAKESDLVLNDRLKIQSFQFNSIARYLNETREKITPGFQQAIAFDDRNSTRLANKVAPGQIPLVITLLLTYKATPFLYYGDEIGLKSSQVRPEFAKDILESLEPGKSMGRDQSRGPMPWSAEQWGGFSKSRPWLPLASDWEYLNVDAGYRDQNSILNLVRSLIKCREDNPTLITGDQSDLIDQDQVITFTRSLGTRKLIVALNYSNHHYSFKLDQGKFRTVFSTSSGIPHSDFINKAPIFPFEGIILEKIP